MISSEQGAGRHRRPGAPARATQPIPQVNGARPGTRPWDRAYSRAPDCSTVDRSVTRSAREAANALRAAERPEGEGAPGAAQGRRGGGSERELMSLWELYRSNRDDIAPLLAPLGSVLVGLGTVLVGGLVARAALRQARTATEQAKIATEVARIANRQAETAAGRHEEQTRADRQRRITDTFSKSVEQLAIWLPSTSSQQANSSRPLRCRRSRRAVPFRFRRSIRHAPGIKLNVGKHGASTSAGARAEHTATPGRLSACLAAAYPIRPRHADARRTSPSDRRSSALRSRWLCCGGSGGCTPARRSRMGDKTAPTWRASSGRRPTLLIPPSWQRPEVLSARWQRGVACVGQVAAALSANRRSATCR